jgi:hypothetical protein
VSQEWHSLKRVLKSSPRAHHFSVSPQYFISGFENFRISAASKPECHIIIEFVAPASRFNEEAPVFSLFIKTFKLKACPKMVMHQFRSKKTRNTLATSIST